MSTPYAILKSRQKQLKRLMDTSAGQSRRKVFSKRQIDANGFQRSDQKSQGAQNKSKILQQSYSSEQGPTRSVFVLPISIENIKKSRIHHNVRTEETQTQSPNSRFRKTDHFFQRDTVFGRLSNDQSGCKMSTAIVDEEFSTEELILLDRPTRSPQRKSPSQIRQVLQRSFNRMRETSSPHRESRYKAQEHLPTSKDTTRKQRNNFPQTTTSVDNSNYKSLLLDRDLGECQFYATKSHIMNTPNSTFTGTQTPHQLYASPDQNHRINGNNLNITHHENKIRWQIQSPTKKSKINQPQQAQKLEDSKHRRISTNGIQMASGPNSPNAQAGDPRGITLANFGSPKQTYSKTPKTTKKSSLLTPDTLVPISGQSESYVLVLQRELHGDFLEPFRSGRLNMSSINDYTMKCKLSLARKYKQHQQQDGPSVNCPISNLKPSKVDRSRFNSKKITRTAAIIQLESKQELCRNFGRWEVEADEDYSTERRMP